MTRLGQGTSSELVWTPVQAHYLERLYQMFPQIDLMQRKKAAAKKVQHFDVIVAGVKKCGTSSLQLFMKYHPELKIHNLYAREGHYFDIGISLLIMSHC